MSFEFTDKQKQAWASIAKDPTKRETLAEIITEVADVNHLPSTYMSLLLNSRRLNPGDALRKVVRKGIKVHTLVNNGIASL